MARIWSVNLGRGGPGAAGVSGIDKRPVDGPVEVRAPAARGVSGLSGGRVRAGMNVNVWDVTDPIQALVRRGTPVDRTRLADPSVPLTDL